MRDPKQQQLVKGGPTNIGVQPIVPTGLKGYAGK